MALVHDDEHIVGEVVKQAVRRCAGFATFEVAAVVLHTGAITEFLNHLDVVMHAFVNTLGFQFQTGIMEEGYLVFQVALYLTDSAVDALA